MTAEDVLVPDCAGTYTRGDDLDGYPTYTREDDAWSIWYHAVNDFFYISPEIGEDIYEAETYWNSPILDKETSTLFQSSGLASGRAIWTPGE